jgi:hypothetical protein
LQLRMQGILHHPLGPYFDVPYIAQVYVPAHGLAQEIWRL